MGTHILKSRLTLPRCAAMKSSILALSLPSASALCCYDGCAVAPTSCNPAGEYCSQSADTCGTCNGSWCDDGPTPVPPPTPPTPTPPSPTPSGVVEYCPDPTVDFQEEREPGAT